MAEVARKDELLTDISRGYCFTCAPVPENIPGLIVLGVNRHGDYAKEGPDRIFVFMQDSKWYESHADKVPTLCEDDLQLILTIAATSFIEHVAGEDQIPEC